MLVELTKIRIVRASCSFSSLKQANCLEISAPSVNRSLARSLACLFVCLFARLLSHRDKHQVQTQITWRHQLTNSMHSTRPLLMAAPHLRQQQPPSDSDNSDDDNDNDSDNNDNVNANRMATDTNEPQPQTGPPSVDRSEDSQQQPSSQAAPSDDEEDFDCPNNGIFADKSSGCQAYHVCQSGAQVKSTFQCPIGTLFNDIILTCDFAHNVQCNGKQGAASTAAAAASSARGLASDVPPVDGGSAGSSLNPVDAATASLLDAVVDDPVHRNKLERQLQATRSNRKREESYARAQRARQQQELHNSWFANHPKQQQQSASPLPRPTTAAASRHIRPFHLQTGGEPVSLRSSQSNSLVPAIIASLPPAPTTESNSPVSSNNDDDGDDSSSSSADSDDESFGKDVATAVAPVFASETNSASPSSSQQTNAHKPQTGATIVTNVNEPHSFGVLINHVAPQTASVVTHSVLGTPSGATVATHLQRAVTSGKLAHRAQLQYQPPPPPLQPQASRSPTSHQQARTALVTQQAQPTQQAHATQATASITSRQQTKPKQVTLTKPTVARHQQQQQVRDTSASQPQVTRASPSSSSASQHSGDAGDTSTMLLVVRHPPEVGRAAPSQAVVKLSAIPGPMSPPPPPVGGHQRHGNGPAMQQTQRRAVA